MNIFLYSRRNCQLCDEVKASLINLQAKYPFTIHVIDVDQVSSSRNLYDQEIPVVEVGSFVLKAPITNQELEAAISETYRMIERRIETLLFNHSAHLLSVKKAGWIVFHTGLQDTTLD